jgi:putative flavoprotein involved in K+ transport
MNNPIETIIVGGGQGGLSASYYLKQLGREHLVLEGASRPGHAWRDDRWDSFTLVTPNWAWRLPGAEYKGSDPGGFMPRDDIVDRFERYIAQNDLPVIFGVSVLSIASAPSGYSVATDQGAYAARNVIVATGLFQKPKIPPYNAGMDGGILSIPSGKYRNPDSLPPGGVLVVGSGQSGCQIAEELYQAGRSVYLCVGSAGRAPRRYRGRDTFEWLNLSGFLERTPDKLPSPQARFAGNPHLSGKNGGHGLNLHQFYRDGVQLLGRLQGIEDGRISLAPDLKENLAKVDGFEDMIIKAVDDFIEKNGLDAPEDYRPRLQDGYSAPEILSLNLKDAGITSVIWALGYHFDFSLVKLPVFDSFGFPITEAGVVSAYPGLYFASLPWLPSQKTGLLLGVGEQAAHITEHLHGRRQT